MPDRWSAAVFATKVAGLRLRRGLVDMWSGPRRLPQVALIEGAAIAGESRTPLWSDSRPGEQHHQLGKVHNLRRAVRALDGVMLPAGDTFSFWKQVGWPGRARGFVDGRMLQQGCMVPATGGGLCQLSNALYDAALKAGCTIVERHAHSRVVPGSAAAFGRDATVAWNYVDLRFRSDRELRLAVHMTADELTVRLHGTAASDTGLIEASASAERAAAHSCGTCAATTCFRHERSPTSRANRTAFLVDEVWPEFTAFVGDTRASGDEIGLPMPDRWTRDRRRTWPVTAFDRVHSAPLPALARSLRTRFAKPGAPKRRAESFGSALIAQWLGAQLSPEVTNLCVAQSYLPHLWKAGHLGGRRFSVLMTRPPMQVLHERLDAAFAIHPDRATLADFRAARELVAFEAKALERAEMIATPHPEIAALFPGRALLMPWNEPSVPTLETAPPTSRRIAFPGPTLARKGAYEVREAARALDLEVLLLGGELEGPEFWRGVRTIRPTPGSPPHGWLAGIAAVVQPALVQEQPRHLLVARAAGVPVVATAACGLDGAGVTVVPPLDAPALTNCLYVLFDKMP
jgi:hypothetical protein